MGYIVFFELPASTVVEPFVVIGSHDGDTSKTAQTGAVIEDMSVMVDIFLNSNSRTEAEEIRAHAVRLLAREYNLFTRLLKSSETGRELYRINMRIQKTIY